MSTASQQQQFPPAKHVRRRKGAGAARVIAALEMFYDGKPYDEIARQCGYADRASAYVVIQRELEQAKKMPRDMAAAAHEERLRGLWEVYYPQARAGDLDAAKFCATLLDRYAKFYGLDEPTKVEDVSAGPMIVYEAFPTPWLRLPGLPAAVADAAAPSQEAQPAQEDAQ